MDANSLQISLLAGNLGGRERFVRDCLHRHTVCNCCFFSELIADICENARIPDISWPGRDWRMNSKFVTPATMPILSGAERCGPFWGAKPLTP
jgi:hypothetical protein